MSLHFDLGGLNHLDGWSQFDVLMVCLMTVGQIIFVGTWMVLPWWKEWIGRALMIKSSTLALLLGLTITNTMLMLRGIDYRGMNEVQATGYLLVNVGVWSQVIALGSEIRKGTVAEALDMHMTGAQVAATRPHRFRPLKWAGALAIVAGCWWYLASSWDVLSGIVVAIGVGLITINYTTTRPVNIDKILEDEGN